jgi:hypothetical protein
MNERMPDDIFSHPDLLSLEMHHEDPETARMMREVHQLDRAIREHTIAMDEVPVVLQELNRRWVAHVDERMLLRGTVYVRDDDGVEETYVDRALAYFKGFTVDEPTPDSFASHVRYCVATAIEHPTTDDDTATYTVDASAHVSFPDLVSVERMSYLASGIVDDIDQVISQDDVTFAEIVKELSELEFVRNIQKDDMQGVYNVLAAYLNHVTCIEDVLAVTVDVDGVTYTADGYETPSVSQGFHTIVSPTFFFFIHDENYVELCLMGDVVAKRRGMSGAMARIVPLATVSNPRAVPQP